MAYVSSIAQQGEATILTKVPAVSVEYDEESICELLKIKIEKPELSERERYLLDLAQSGNTAQLSFMVKTFSDEILNLYDEATSAYDEVRTMIDNYIKAL